MLELLWERSQSIPEEAAATGAPSQKPPLGYRGPERRHITGLGLRWLTAALDEIDYGVLLLDPHERVLYSNHAARAQLSQDHPLRLVGHELRTRQPRDAADLHAALQAASRRGLRKMLTLGVDDQRVGVSVVPLCLPDFAPSPFDPRGSVGGATLLMLGKRKVGSDLAVEAFARGHGLSPSETGVLLALYKGVRPTDIAVERDVAICTVRSQIGSIRIKTGSSSIRALVRQVSALPPLMGVLERAAVGQDPRSLVPGCSPVAPLQRA